MIPLLADAPTLDASFPEWADVAPMAVDRPLWHHSDAQATARVAMHGKTLYVAVEVHGDTFVPGGGIAGDHVEVWFGDPTLRDDEVAIEATYAELVPAWTSMLDETAPRAAQYRADLDASRPVQHLVVSASGPALAEAPEARTVPLASATRATADGWSAELAIPLTLLPAVEHLDLTSLALRVDVIDADGTRPQDALLSTAARRDWRKLPTLKLAAPVHLDDGAPWTDLEIPTDGWLREDDRWVAAQRSYDWIDLVPVQTRLAARSFPEVEVVPGPVDVRVVGARVDRMTAKGWTPWLGEVDQPSATATWAGRLLITTVESNDRGIPGPGMCGAATSDTFSIWRFEHGTPKELVHVDRDTCMAWRECEVNGDVAHCSASDDPDDDAAPEQCWSLDKVRGRVTEVQCPENGE